MKNAINMLVEEMRELVQENIRLEVTIDHEGLPAQEIEEHIYLNYPVGSYKHETENYQEIQEELKGLKEDNKNLKKLLKSLR